MNTPTPLFASDSGGGARASPGYDLWSWTESTPAPAQDQPSPEDETPIAIAPEGALDWSEVVRTFQESLNLAYQKMGFTSPDPWEFFSTILPQEDAYLEPLWQMSWRIQALARQLPASGPICFHALRSYDYHRGLCGLCGIPLRQAQRYTCSWCAIAKHLVLASISWAAWLHFLKNPEGMKKDDEQGWLTLLS